MKRIIILSRYFPPMAAIGGKRVEKIFKRLLINGVEPRVITIKPNNYSEAVSYDCKVEYVPYYGFSFRIFKILKAKTDLSLDKSLFFDLIRKNLKRIDKYIIPLFLIFKFYVSANRFIKCSNPSYLFSTSPPSWVYFSALLLKLKYPEINWIVDFRDPWFHKSDSYHWGVQQSIDRWIFKKTIHRADVIVATTQSCLDLVKSILPPTYNKKVKFIYLPNGVELDLFSDVSPVWISSMNQINIGHIGDLDYAHRNPLPFLTAFDLFISEKNSGYLNMNFWGKMRSSWSGVTIQDHIDNLNNSSNVVCHGSVSSSYALAVTISLDVLVLFALDQYLQIPAKVYEYLLSNKPILAFCEKNSETYNLLVGFDGVFLCETNCIKSISSALGKLIEHIDIGNEISREKDFHKINFNFHFERFLIEAFSMK